MRLRASLPMYELPAVTEVTDAWWRGLAQHLRGAGVTRVPAKLTRSGDLSADWRAPDLLLSQTCGYPLTHALAASVQLVATPRYHAPGCRGAWYSSAIVIAADNPAQAFADLTGHVAVINGPDSQSGCHALRYMAAMLTGGDCFFNAIRTSGSHAASLEAVRHGCADVAAVDAVTHALMVRHAPEKLTGTRVLTYSPSTPGLPYITRGNASAAYVARLRSGLAAAAADPELAWVRQALLLDGFEVLSCRAYQAILDMENEVNKTHLPAWQ
jgi:ABC-type phosphate/phosphonate transport system substrate-binding protein